MKTQIQVPISPQELLWTKLHHDRFCQTTHFLSVHSLPFGYQKDLSNLTDNHKFIYESFSTKI